MSEIEAPSTVDHRSQSADVAESPPEQPTSDVAAVPPYTEKAGPNAIGRLRIGLLTLILLASGAIAIKPTYNWWHARQSRYYDNACEEAAHTESWEYLESISRQWVEWDPGASKGWVHLADALLRQGDVQGAVDALDRIDDRYPGALDALAIRGDILFSDLNQPYAAMENWERMLRINDAATVARQRMIYFYAITMQREKMRQEIFRAIELEGEPPEAYTYLYLAYDINFSDGLRLTRKWLESYPDDETLQVASAVYLATFQTDNSLSIMETSPVAAGDQSAVNRLRNIYPDNIELLSFFLAKAVYEGNQADVLNILKDAPSSAEADPRFWSARGWYLLEQEQFEDAAKALRTALSLNPFDWKSRNLLSSVLRQLNQPEEAAEESRLSLIGKELNQELFELPNARLIGNDLAQRIYDFSLEIGAEEMHRGLERRLGQFQQ